MYSFNDEVLEEMIQAARQTKKAPNLRLHDGRDEMNLVEFPFATLSERSGNTNVLEFQTEVYDRVLGKPVQRKLTVTGDAKYGLPTAKDEEVYLGLLQLTKLFNEFEEPKVKFTRSQLIKLMGWKNRDWSYHRINKAFARLTGVRLFYENAWRDNAKKKYRTKGGFGLLDSFEIRDGRSAAEEERLSEFRWNSVIFDSFQSGYLKKLDYRKVRDLSTIARRIYRFLDKHFHPPHRTELVFPLKVFAFEHIGLSRSYDNAQIRRALVPALEELAITGFLEPLPVERSIRKDVTKQIWEICVAMPGYGKRSQPLPKRQSDGARVAHEPQSQVSNSTAEKSDPIQAYLHKLGKSQRAELLRNAMASASGFLRETLENAGGSGPLAAECRRQIVEAYLKEQGLA